MTDEMVTIELDTWDRVEGDDGTATAADMRDAMLTDYGVTVTVESTGERTLWGRYGQAGTWLRYTGTRQALATVIDSLWALEPAETDALVERAAAGERRPAPPGGWPA